MSLTPCAFSVAAVVNMMKSAMMFEKPMPTSVSSCMRAICRGACSRRLDQTAWPLESSFSSSTSSPACQKKR